MKWFRRVAIALGVLVALLAVLPFFFSLNDYIPQIEREVSARLGEPVKVGGLRAALLPVPHAAADGIVIGKSGDLKVGKVTVTPVLLSLLEPTKVIRSIEIDGLEITQKAIERIAARTKPESRPGAPQAAPQVEVQSIRLDDALLRLDKTSIGPLDARIRLGANNAPQEASVLTRDGKLRIDVTPGQSNYRIDARAKSWTLPAGPAIVFDELTIKGVATPAGANLDQVAARLYGGTVKGGTEIAWRKGLQLKGSFVVSAVELKSLVPLLAPGKNMSGKLDAKPVFSAGAASAGQLAGALRLDTPFNVRDGVLYGVDIQKAATSLVKQGSGGGETRFDELSGHLALDRGSYRFTQLKISSGSLAAAGNVGISPRKELSGRIEARVTVAGASATVPLNVTGTTDSPLLLPTGGTVAGAAVGTAILGPGVGTSVGARIGNWTENLFGSKEQKK